MSCQFLKQSVSRDTERQNIPKYWRVLVLFFTVVFFMGLSVKKPWTGVLDDPSIVLVDSAVVRTHSSAESPRDNPVAALPDQWTNASPIERTKFYSFTFDRSTLGQESLAIFVPFARDNLILRLNGKTYGAFAYSSAQDRWLWNKPLLFRLAEGVLFEGENTVELEVSSASAMRVAVSEVYIGPTRKLDEVFTMGRRLQVTLPFATLVLLVMSALALLGYASHGGAVYIFAALFNISAAVSLLSWVLVIQPIDLQLWYILITLSQPIALTFVALFVCVYFGLARWIGGVILIFAMPVLCFGVAAVSTTDLNETIQLLKGSAFIWAICGCFMLAVVVWHYVHSNNFDDRVMLLGTILLVTYALRDSLVHLEFVSPSIGLHIPMGYTFFALSMAFVFLRSAVRRSRELERFRLDLSSRLESQTDEITKLTSKQKELELNAMAGRLSHIYSYEFRNPVGACLATGNLALKQIESGATSIRSEVQKIVDSSMECSELLAQMFASEVALPAVESSSVLRVPEWLNTNVDELARAFGCAVVISRSDSYVIRVQPRVLLQAVRLLLGDSDQRQNPLRKVKVQVTTGGKRVQLQFTFSRSLEPDQAGRSRHWVESYLSARALLNADDSDLRIFYNELGRMNAFVIDVPRLNMAPANEG